MTRFEENMAHNCNTKDGSNLDSSQRQGTQGQQQNWRTCQKYLTGVTLCRLTLVIKEISASPWSHEAGGEMPQSQRFFTNNKYQRNKIKRNENPNVPLSACAFKSVILMTQRKHNKIKYRELKIWWFLHPFCVEMWYLTDKKLLESHGNSFPKFRPQDQSFGSEI